MVTCKSILVSADFSETSHAALDYGRALADRCWSTLHVLHVVSHVVGPGRAMFWGFSASELESRLEEEARHHMEAGTSLRTGWPAGQRRDARRASLRGNRAIRKGPERGPDCDGNQPARSTCAPAGRWRRREGRSEGAVPSPDRAASQSKSASGPDVTPMVANRRRRSRPLSTLGHGRSRSVRAHLGAEKSTDATPSDGQTTSRVRPEA